MKVFIYIGFVTVVILCMGCSKNTNDDPPTPKNPHTELQDMADGLMSDYKALYPDFPGGLALQVISNDHSWFVSSGMAPETNNGIHFRAASNTKTFTSVAILLLHQQGKLNINDHITDTIPGSVIPYVPDNSDYAVPFKGQITILQLLQHKAGVYDIANEIVPDTVSAAVPYKGCYYVEWAMGQDPTHTFTFDELVGVIAQCSLYYFMPATGYHYSNTGYSILGKIIERVSGMGYADFIQTNIMQPMNLSQSSMPWQGTDVSIPAPFAPGYIYFSGVIDTTESNMSANVSEGNLITTPHDLAHFIRNLLRGEGVLSLNTINELMLAPVIPPDTVTSYTCGISLNEGIGYGHTGAHAGYLSLMASDPETDFSVVAFMNGWNVENGVLPGIMEQFENVIIESALRAKEIVQ